MCRVNLKENPRNNDRLLLQQLFKERQTVVDGVGQVLEVEPDVKGRDGWDFDGETHGGEAGKDMVAFVMEVFLECDLLFLCARGFEQGEGGDLEAVSPVS